MPLSLIYFSGLLLYVRRLFGDRVYLAIGDSRGSSSLDFLEVRRVVRYPFRVPYVGEVPTILRIGCLASYRSLPPPH